MSFDSRRDDVIEKYKQSKEEELKLKERRQVCLEEMKKEYGVNTAEELEELIAKDDKRIEKLEGKIEPMLTELEDELKL